MEGWEARVCGRYRGTEVADVTAMAGSGKVFYVVKYVGKRLYGDDRKAHYVWEREELFRLANSLVDATRTHATF